MRPLAVLLAALVLAPPASAHGGEIIARAIDGLGRDPVYVDETAVPTLEPAEADRLRDRIRAAGGRIYVAVLPADAQHELPTAHAVLEEIAAAVGGASSFAVLVGGQLRAASVDEPDRARELEEELVADTAAPPAVRLERFVAGIDEARSGGGPAALAVGGTIAAAALVAATVALLLVARRRRTPPAARETAA